VGIYLSLTGNLEQLRSVSNQMSEGDLAQRLKIDTKDELNQIGISFKMIGDGFSLAVSGVVNLSQHLEKVTEQMVDTG
jgi:methyl-accepting chemotaxis protein